MLIDVHAHFLSAECGRTDWERVNARRLTAGEQVGIDVHIASILGTFGYRSPTYFPSPEDVSHGNRTMADLCRVHPGTVYGYCTVNPNFGDHALEEIERGIADGCIGLKLAASRRANDPLVDGVVAAATTAGWPVLHHAWQHRRRDWPGQEASDAVELVALAARHPAARFILAHIGGGGDWSHSLRAVQAQENIWIDLSGSGVDVDMLHEALDTVGTQRLVWGCDLTMCTGVAKLRYLESLPLPDDALDRIRWKNAWDLFGRLGNHADH